MGCADRIPTVDLLHCYAMVIPSQKRLRVAVLLLSTIAVLVVLLLPPWRANTRISDPEWLSTASPQDVAREASAVLRFPLGNHHDACLLLVQAGNASSVPALVHALSRFDESDDGNLCTKDHCLSALRLIAGEDHGSTFRDWSDWASSATNSLRAGPRSPATP